MSFYYYYSTHRETRTLASLFKMPARFRRSIKATSKHSSSRREKNKKIVAFQQSRPRVRRWKKREKRKRWKVEKRQKPFNPWLKSTIFLSFHRNLPERGGGEESQTGKRNRGKDIRELHIGGNEWWEPSDTRDLALLRMEHAGAEML